MSNDALLDTASLHTVCMMAINRYTQKREKNLIRISVPKLGTDCLKKDGSSQFQGTITCLVCIFLVAVTVLLKVVSFIRRLG